MLLFLTTFSLARATQSGPSCADLMARVWAVAAEAKKFAPFEVGFTLNGRTLGPERVLRALEYARASQRTPEALMSAVADVEARFVFPVYDMGDYADRVPTFEEAVLILKLADAVKQSPEAFRPRFAEVLDGLERRAPQGERPGIADVLRALRATP